MKVSVSKIKEKITKVHNLLLTLENIHSKVSKTNTDEEKNKVLDEYGLSEELFCDIYHELLSFEKIMENKLNHSKIDWFD